MYSSVFKSNFFCRFPYIHVAVLATGFQRIEIFIYHKVRDDSGLIFRYRFVNCLKIEQCFVAETNSTRERFE